MSPDTLQEDFIKTANRFGKMRYELMFPDISKREYEMLAVIGRYMEENSGTVGICVSALAGMLKVSSPAVSRMIGVLEEKGYIGRDADRKDRRNIRVYLTDSGKEIKRQAEERMRRMMSRVVERMGEEQTRHLIELWNRLADIMEEELKGA